MLRVMKPAAIGKTETSFRRSHLLAYFLDVNPRGTSAARPKNYRKRAIARTGNRERERHLRQMAAGRLDFSASYPIIWRTRPYAPKLKVRFPFFDISYPEIRSSAPDGSSSRRFLIVGSGRIVGGGHVH